MSYPSLADIIANPRGESGQALIHELKRTGWAFVGLTESLSQLRVRCTEALSPYLDRDAKATEGMEPSSLGHLGHFGLQKEPKSHKSAFRWLSGPEAEKLPQQKMYFPFFPAPAEAFFQLSKEFDQALAGVNAAAADLLNQEVLDRLDIPFLKAGGYNLVDVACYHNAAEADVAIPANNCAEHYDPGLFTLAIFQSALGLQLKDLGTGQWVEAPSPDTTVGIVWCGAAATEASAGLLPHCLHRVPAPASLPAPRRIALWAEICTSDQIFPEKKWASWSETPEVIIVPNLRGIKGENRVRVLPEGMAATLSLIGSVHGLPFSKIMQRPIKNENGEIIAVKRGF